MNEVLLNDFNLIVVIITGIGAVVGTIWGFIKLINKTSLIIDDIEELKAKECPCAEVKALRETVLKHSQYFENDSMTNRDMDKRLAVLETTVSITNKKLDEIAGDIKTLLKGSGAGKDF